MWWAESLDQFTPQQQESRNRQAMANFVRREVIELIGV